MLKRLLLIIAGIWMSIGLAFAQVDVNKADQAALDSVKGIGPKISKTIIDERTKNGNFKDWPDFENRVKGIGDKNAVKMSEAGLTINGQSKPGTTTASKGSAKGSSTTAATSQSSGSKATSSGGSSSDKSGSSASGKSGTTTTKKSPSGAPATQ